MHEIYTLSFLAAQQRHQHFAKYQSSSNWGVSLGSLHLILGFLAVILGIVGLLAEYHANRYGSAVWCGLIFQMTGVMGIVASRKWYSRTYLKCFCLTSAMATFISVILFSLTCLGIANHYVHFDRDYHISVTNYMANVSANIIVLSLLEMAVCLSSVTVTVKAMRWRCARRQPPSQPVFIRETFMTNSETLPKTSDYHQHVAVPDVLLQGVMPNAFNATSRNTRFVSSQLLNVTNFIGLHNFNNATCSNSQVNSCPMYDRCNDKIENGRPNNASIGSNRNY